MGDSVSPVVDGRTRKRTRHPEKWKTNLDKVDRYKPKSLPVYPTCGHSGGAFKCTTLTMKDIQKFHGMVFQKHDKAFQDNFILKHISMNPVKRRRPKTATNALQNMRCKYYIQNGKKEMVPVCLKAFLSVLDISRFRINIIVQKFYDCGLIKDKRGGFKRSAEFQLKTEAIMKFVNSLKCSEVHYCRERQQRKYLPPELNIVKLWEMYMKSEGTIPVKQSYFRHIFVTKYSLGFGSPRTDVCSVCLQLAERLKCEKDDEKKRELQMQKQIHKLRADTFFKLLREDAEDVIMLSFDCQKNLALPRIPDQAVYYSRQFYLYNFTIVQGNSEGPLNCGSVTSYCWMENQFSKGSNTIASCLHDKLNSLDYTDIRKLRLFADGCVGQNKNSVIVAMVAKWLSTSPADIKEIELVFPVTGHSFIPPDRVLGLIEKNIRSTEVIVKPEEILQIIGKHATVKIPGKDLDIMDFKESTKGVIKSTSTWHFQISKVKRIFVKRTKSNTILVRGEANYTNDIGVYRSIFVKNKGAINLVPKVISEGIPVSKEKQTDVAKLLLKHFGDKWMEDENLQIYVNLITGGAGKDFEDDDEPCEFQEEDANLVI